MTSDEHYRAPFEPLLSGVTLGAGRTIRRRSPRPSRRDTAAIIVEPIQGEGGVRPLTPAFAAAINEASARTGALVIADEVQCGLGRTGYPFYFAALGLKPHLVSLGKALGGGVPIGAALISEEVAATIAFGDHGSTYGGNLLACRAALCFLDELVGGGLIAHVARVGRLFEQRLRAMAARHPIVKEVRGQRPDVGPRADVRRGAGRAGGARARRHRQPHGRNRRAAAAAARHHRRRRPTRRSIGSMRRSAPSPQDGGMTRMTRRVGSRFAAADARRTRAGCTRSSRPTSRKGTCCRARSSELTVHAERFVVAVRGRTIVGCAELAPLSPQVAEVRSLAVDAGARGIGVGTMLVEELRQRARREGFDKLCAFTHAPGLLQPDGLLDRAAPLAAREDLHRLREVPVVPHVRAVRDGRAARAGRRGRVDRDARSRCGSHDRARPSRRSR